MVIKKDEFYQGFTVTGHPLGDLHIRIYADKVEVKGDSVKCTVPLNFESLHKLTTLEEECASNTAH